MLRFVILKDGSSVVDVMQCSTTNEASTITRDKNSEGEVSASWTKVESMQELCDRDPYVHIWWLKKQIEEMAPKEDAAKEPQPKELPKFWSNGKVKKALTPKS